MDKYKIGLGYNAVPPPYTRNFMPPKSDLVYPSLDDFVDVNESVSESVVKKPNVETNEPETSRKENGAPIIEDWVSDSDKENVPKVKTVKMFNKPSFSKINFVKSTEQVKSPRKTPVDKNRQKTPSPRGNKRNWNQQMSQKLGSDFEMLNKACHVCGSFDHLKNDCNNWYNNERFAKPVWTNVQRVNKQNFSKLTHLNPKRNMVPRTILTRSGPISLNTARPVDTVQPRTAVNTAKGTRVNTAKPKAVFSVVKENKGNAVKASACWGNPQQDLKDKGVIDSGCSGHMTGNRSYLTNYEEIYGEFFTFRENADFAEIVDFLNANPIRYALIIHAKVKGKIIVISESSLRRDLQFDDEDEVNAVYDTPSHTKKIFANIRRQGKDFSGTVTPLFSFMLVPQADMGEGSGQPTDPQHTSTSAQPSNEEPITVPSSSQAKKTHRVLDLETIKTAQAKEIGSLKKRVKKLERKRKLKTLGINLFKIGTFKRRSLGFDADMDEVFKDVEVDAEQVISAAANEVSTEVKIEKGSKTRAEGSSKRTKENLQQESTKKQKMDDDKELKQCFEIILDDGDDVTLDATPLSVKIPIVDYKIYQEGKKSFF
ncbi:hypothetical protein Tco_1344767 [Tanacetum coccineum]